MKVALAQINNHLGAFEYNAKKILDYIQQSKNNGCELVVFPETSLFGYHPMDLLESSAAVSEQLKWLNWIQKNIPSDITAIVGAFTKNPNKSGRPWLNAAIIMERGKKERAFYKQLMPTYDVFDDHRHVEPGETKKNIVNINGKKVLITICEDIWAWPEKSNRQRVSQYPDNPLGKISKKGIRLVINLSSSPYTLNKFNRRLEMIQKTCRHFKSPMIYVNQVGGQDELVFDGQSIFCSAQGKILARGVAFKEQLMIIDVANATRVKSSNNAAKSESSLAPRMIADALELGIRDFVHKTGLKRVHLGLSGGVDSALVCALAVRALGPKNVTAIALPGPFSDPLSLELARSQAALLKCNFLEMPIGPSYEQLKSSIDTSFGINQFGVVHENLQARIRGVCLMAFANSENSLLLNTSNKTELGVGFSTLYGDHCGGLSPIGDLLKRQVYFVAKMFSEEGLIPERILSREPSAELAPNQKDSDRLPEYEILDPIIESLVEKKENPKNELSGRIYNLIMNSEFKRWQSPPILKVSDHAFGRGRRYPISHAFRANN